MIDPVIFTINLGKLELAFRWYGLLIAIGVMVSAWITEKEIVRRGGKPEFVWDALIWVLPAGIIGARIWYVLNDIFGGGRTFLDSPGRIIRITEGGLHIFGAVIFGLGAAYIFARRHKVDILLLLDSVAPAMLIGQALARPANFINQELYGPPTDLPWGIPIDSLHRLSPWNNLVLYPEETTRFHPTFAYEMVWNLLAAGVIMWFVRRYEEKIKPGTAFAGWLLLAGIGRVIIETFRPDQPRIPGTDMSWSRLIYALLAIVGLFWLLVRYEIIKLPFLSPGPEKYKLPGKKWRKR
ncbi:MAG: prolipoprotein diacylglyceryl transferase [Anaerolineales bacterium]|nr:prolipoprotein diacylglyceryl transferase [Chloroflexota bacterium]MBL6980956.1 prolipoprotein diacylglyceryl transferase [Anaerolineales bacterium]